MGHSGVGLVSLRRFREVVPGDEVHTDSAANRECPSAGESMPLLRETFVSPRRGAVGPALGSRRVVPSANVGPFKNRGYAIAKSLAMLSTSL